MRLASKIFLGFSLVIVVLAAVGVLSLRAVGRLASVNGEIASQTLPALRLASGVRDTLLTMARLEARFIVLRDRRYAVIIDEAHSSQSGESATALKKALGELGSDDIDEDGDLLTASALARGRHPNLSYFAFTATPKSKTLQLFGTRNPQTGKDEPFHVYSMRQAIEEGFILDVLRNYITYTARWRLTNAAVEEKEAAQRAIAAGTPDIVRNDPAVVEAYLGGSVTAIERSAGAGGRSASSRDSDLDDYDDDATGIIGIPVQERPLSEVVPGLGAAREQALLDAFGSVEAVLTARPDELQKVRGIGPGLAARIASSLATGLSSGRAS